MTTPTTPEGKALLHEWDIGDPSYAEMEAGIAKVEQSAATAERARIQGLVEALPGMNGRQDAIGGALEVRRADVLAILDTPEPKP